MWRSIDALTIFKPSMQLAGNCCKNKQQTINEKKKKEKLIKKINITD